MIKKKKGVVKEQIGRKGRTRRGRGNGIYNIKGCLWHVVGREIFVG